MVNSTNLVAQVTAVDMVSVVGVGNTALPEEGTPAQLSEGNRVSALDITITPQSASNILLIEVEMLVRIASDNTNRGIAIFDASVSNAIGGSLSFEAGAASQSTLVARVRVTAGATSQKTFQVHIGS